MAASQEFGRQHFHDPLELGGFCATTELVVETADPVSK